HCRADADSGMTWRVEREAWSVKREEGDFILHPSRSTLHAPRATRHLTREGRYWLFLSLLLLGLGLYKGVNLLCLLAYVMLACLALNLLLAGRRLRHLRGRRRIEEPAFAGEPFAVELRATNIGR